MIHIDVKVLFTGKSYEFACDPGLASDQLIRQISESVLSLESLKDESNMDRIWEQLRLCSPEDRRLLPSGRSLAECGINHGSRLLLF